MNVFEVVKENVTARQAAEAYGLKVGRTGMACCPFHSDKSPSMKLDERYYCFGCGATGDAVDLTAKLFGIGLREPAHPGGGIPQHRGAAYRTSAGNGEGTL